MAAKLGQFASFEPRFDDYVQ